MAYICRVNGVAYTVTKDKNGKEIYDPPLPKHVKKEWQRRKDEMDREGFQAPKLRTTSTFHAGRGSLIDQLGGDENWAHHINKEHRKRTGKSIGANDVYLSQVAKFPGDPDAVFDASCSHQDMERSIEKLAADYQDRMKPQRLAPDLVDELEASYRASGDTRPSEELRHEIVEKHGQSKDAFDGDVE